MKKALLLISLLSIILVDFAQINPGINTSTWGGVSNVNWNPAIADGRYQADVSLGAVNSGFTQNHAFLKEPKSIFKNTDFKSMFATGTAITDKQNKTRKMWTDLDATPVNSSTVRTLNQWTQIEGPGSFMFPFGKGKNAIAISWHYNNARTIQLLPGSFATSSKTATFNNTEAKWMDVGITYSRALLDKEQHFVKIGVTAKPLVGLEVSTLSMKNFSYNLNGNAISTSQTSLITGHNQSLSGGFAGDFGLVYEWRPNKDKYRYDIDTFTGILPRYKNLYKLAFGLSIIDMGALFSTANTYTSKSLTNANLFNPDAVADNLTGGAATKRNVLLPTRFNIFLDYNIGKGFGLNLNASVSEYFSQSNSQLAYGSYISLVPRFDMPMVGVYLPFSYNFTSMKPNLGLSMRAGPVWFGLSDIIGMASGNIASTAFFGGVKIPIFYRSPKDKDKDKVSKKYDLCLEEMGTWASQGCADKDADGIRDAVDACPEDAGKAEFNGCPDRDNDGVIDKDDLCPDLAGLVRFNGCGDKDSDGVQDKLDLCPDEAGPVEFKGCPDSDGDGVPNSKDKCKDKKGDAAHAGCPDTDGDGVFDNEDDDVEVEGPVENRGAPWADSDGDGIFDNEDMCKILPGPPEYHGCPTPTRKNLVSELTLAYDDTLFFESNIFELSARNTAKLSAYAKKMNTQEQKYYNIVLVGHTDNAEWDANTREKLSLKRGRAAYNALIDFGIDKKRIEIDGMGDEQPIGDNSKATGRKQNRRVMIYTKITSN